MKRKAFKSANSGFTLVEMMVGLLVGLLVSAAAIGAFLGHTLVVYEQVSYNQASEDVSEAYAILSRLLRQAERDSVVISRTETGGVVTAVTIDLDVPAGFSVWPNTKLPYDKNSVRIAWSSSGNDAYKITVANGAPTGVLDPAKVFAGANTGTTTRITGVNLVSDGRNPASYSFSISGKAFARDRLDGNSNAKGITVNGLILPRN